MEEILLNLNKIYAALVEHAPIYLGALLLISEGLAMVPGIKANSNFQLIVNSLKWLKEKLMPAPKV